MPDLWVRPEELSDADSAFAYEAAVSASYIMWALSGRKFAYPRTVIETYECPDYSYGQLSRPMLTRGQVVNTCSTCGSSATLRLRNRPAFVIEYVEESGTVLDPSAYELVNRAILRPKNRLNWNMCGGIKVRYQFGQPPPTAGRMAARALAEKLACAWTGGDCDLPSRLQSLSRQGVSLTILDPQDFLDQGRTGIYEVDLFLRTANPSKSTHKAKVFSPDLPRAMRIASAEQVPEDTDLVIEPGESFTKDFTGLPGPTLDGIDWKPFGQIELERSGVAVPLGDDFWDYITNGVRLILPDDDTLWDSVTNGTFNLYAVRVDDESVASLIYTSRVFVSTLV